jgi:uncharacterized protein (DUF3820 family)
MMSTLDEMPFGKHKGKALGTVIEEDISYVTWMLEKTDVTLDEDALEYYHKCLGRRY